MEHGRGGQSRRRGGGGDGWRGTSLNVPCTAGVQRAQLTSSDSWRGSYDTREKLCRGWRKRTRAGTSAGKAPKESMTSPGPTVTGGGGVGGGGGGGVCVCGGGGT